MNLECLNGIITDNLAIQIDLTKLKSWDLNTGFTAFSLTKWVGAVSDNINLLDFGLTEFDNGRTNKMWSGITLTPSDTLFSMYRVGYNVVRNPASGNTSGVTATTVFTGYNISGVTTGTSGNYFELNGGYLQGFFKLDGYNYELLPSRYNNGITIETLVNLYSGSSGIFYMMGLRAEDKYNPYFSGETTIEGTVISGRTFDVTSISGVKSSEDNYLNAFYETEVNRKAFIDWGARKKKEYKEYPPIDNIKSNVIAFSLTSDKRLAYKYIDENGLIVENISPNPITATGFTMIAIAFTPNDTINTTDPQLFLCAPRRTGKLIFYINGRAQWILNEFPEYFFKALKNQKEKQIGVPYSISWGGGSFGLRHSWHYDYQKYTLYGGQNTQYINNNFFVEADPIPTECYTPPTGSTYLPGLAFSADSSTFKIVDKCDPKTEFPITVMRVVYTGHTGTTGTTGTSGQTGFTGTSASTYFIKFNHPISVLSNRDYEISLPFFDSGFFKAYDKHGSQVYSRASIVVYGTVDIDIISETQYATPLTMSDILNLTNSGLHPFPDRQEYEYIYLNGVMYYGATGLPVVDAMAYYYGLLPLSNLSNGNLLTGENGWKPLKLVFRTKENSGQQFVYIGLLLESTDTFNLNVPIYLNDFTYKGADILVQDPEKDNLLIEQNFNSSFIGGIQKLRVYNQGLTSPEILHNALIEAKGNPALNMKVSKGGRIIYR
jgi:hypothetical protein